jgi:hypothetical protein
MSDPVLHEPDPEPGYSAGGGSGSSTPADPKSSTSPSSALPDRAWWVPAILGLLLLGGYVVFVFVMAEKVGVQETEWARLSALFAGVETLAFSAAGFFFGREVNRARAEVAERRASGAEREAADASARGQVLSRELQELADQSEGQPGFASLHGAAGGVSPRPDAQALRLRSLAAQARRWFPTP